MAVINSHMLRTEKPMNHLDHLQHDFYVYISYKFTLEWVYVSCMYMKNTYTCTNYLVHIVLQRFSADEGVHA